MLTQHLKLNCLVVLFQLMFMGCVQPRTSVYINEKAYYEIKRKYSSDSAKLLITYGMNSGATREGAVGTAILHRRDTMKNIKPFTIPWYVYNDIDWLTNDTVTSIAGEYNSKLMIWLTLWIMQTIIGIGPIQV